MCIIYVIFCLKFLKMQNFILELFTGLNFVVLLCIALYWKSEINNNNYFNL